MGKTFYIQFDAENKVTDILTMPIDGYTQVTLPVPLPARCLAGCYTIEGLDTDTPYLLYHTDMDKDTQIETLKAENEKLKKDTATTQAALDDFFMNILPTLMPM